MRSPSKRTAPEFGRATPDTQFNKVVLPAPLGPMTPNVSPWNTSKDTSSTAKMPPKWRDSVSISKTASCAITPPSRRLGSWSESSPRRCLHR